MKYIIMILAVLIFLIPWAFPAKADSVAYTKIIFNFQKAGLPVKEPVSFNIKCYGLLPVWRGENDTLHEVFRSTEECKDYGCAFKNVDGMRFFAVHEEIKYCDLAGETKGNKFIINNFLGDSLKGLVCRNGTPGDYYFYRGDKFYRKTAAYDNCRKAVDEKYNPASNSKLFLCDQYLTPADEVVCGTPQGSNMQVNGKCYPALPDSHPFKQCQTEFGKALAACDQYLKDVTAEIVPKIIRDEKGAAFDRVCEATINLPENNINSEQNTKIAPARKFFVLEVFLAVLLIFFAVF